MCSSGDDPTQHEPVPGAYTLAAPRIAHPDWRLVERREDGAAYVNRRHPMTLICSIARESDGRLWEHISLAHRDRTPRWEELVAVKEWLVGTTTYAYQVVPPRAVYVNLHPNVLHLFRCLEDDGRQLPEFSAVVDDRRTL